MRIVTAVFVIGVAVSLAGAEPVLTSSSVYLGEWMHGIGRYGITFSVDDGTAIGSWAMDLTFTALRGSTINQIKAFTSIVVNEEYEASVYDPVDPSYDMTLDSWAYDPFSGIGPAPQFSETATTYHVHAGTPAAEDQGAVDLAYVVLNGWAIQWEGTISRGGMDYPQSGSSPLTLLDGDANGDGQVTDADYTIWADNYGTGVPSVAVPEPATLCVLTLGGLVMGRRRQRQ